MTARSGTNLPRFITFEGGEGAGKSTQAGRLAETLRALGEEVVLTREPGGSPHAEELRRVILSGCAQAYGAMAEAILFSAARIDHLRETIRPALERGAWVVCDRFADSTRAYQGALGNMDPRLLATLERVVVGPTRPGLTLLLDLAAEEGLSRAHQRSGGERLDRFEAEGAEFHRALRTAFRDIAEAEPDRIRIVSANGSADEVFGRIWAVVSSAYTLDAEKVAS